MAGLIRRSFARCRVAVIWVMKSVRAEEGFMKNFINSATHLSLSSRSRREEREREREVEKGDGVRNRRRIKNLRRPIQRRKSEDTSESEDILALHYSGRVASPCPLPRDSTPQHPAVRVPYSFAPSFSRTSDIPASLLEKHRPVRG